MIAGILPPTGTLGALSAHQVLVSPIAAVAVAVGDLVMFDLASTNTTYTSASAITDPDNKKNPFNVVVLSVAGALGGASTTQTGKGGIFAVVTKAAAAGERCTVCVSGFVDAKVTTLTASPITAGVTVLQNGAGVLISSLGLPLSAGGAPIAIGFTTVTTAAPITATSMKVLFHGYAFATGGG